MTADDFRRKAKYLEGIEYGVPTRQLQKWLPQLADSDPNGTQELAAARAKANMTSHEKEQALPLKKEVGLDPVSLIQKLVVLVERAYEPGSSDADRDDDENENERDELLEIIGTYCVDEAADIVSLLVRRAHPDEYNFYMRYHFGRYFTMLDHWQDDKEYVDPDSKVTYARVDQEREMAKLERPAGITSPVDFRKAIWNKVHPLKEDFDKSGATPWQKVPPDLWRQVEDGLLPSRDKLLPSDSDLKSDPKLWSIDIRVYRDTKYRLEQHAKYMERFVDRCKNDLEGTSCTPWQAQRMIQWWVGGCKKKDFGLPE